MPNYDKLALFPLHAVLFPQMSLPLHIFEERYRIMIGRCLERNEPFGIVLLQHGAEVDCGAGGLPQLHPVGTLARIERAERLADGRYYIAARGESRFAIAEVFGDEPYLTARVKPVWEQNDDPLEVQPMFDRACELFRDYIAGVLSESQRRLSNLQLPQDPALLSYAIGASLQVTLLDKQRLLEARSAGERLLREVELLQMEREAQTFFEADAESAGSDESPDEAGQGGEGRTRTGRRTILRVDPSYSQYFFSKN